MQGKPKIVIVGPGFPYRNGPSIYLSYLCNQLSPDFDITLVNYTMLYPSSLFPGKTQYDESSSTYTFPNVRMVNSLNPLSWIKTAAYINKLNPDLVAFDWWHPFFAPCHRGIYTFLNSKLKKKVLYITENVISHEANKTDKVLTKMALKNARCFLALSESVKKHLQTMFQKEVFLSELPIYDSYKLNDAPQDTRAQFGFDKDDKVILFFGLVRKYKGLDLLLEAFGELAQSDKKLKLLMVGEFYEDIKPYQDIVDKHNIQSQVILENRYINNEEVEKYMQACDVVALPYRSATQSGILNVAYSFRKPVVVTNVGELGQLVVEGKTGLVIPTADVPSVKKGIEQFLQLKESGVNFSEHIQDYIQNKHKFKEVNNVFRNILKYINGN